MRSKGYHWVRFRDGGWEPAKWNSEDWHVLPVLAQPPYGESTRLHTATHVQSYSSESGEI